MFEVRQKACCPKCGRLCVEYDKKEHVMHCNRCGATWHKSLTTYKDVKVFNNLPLCLKKIVERKAAKKVRQTAGEVTT